MVPVSGFPGGHTGFLVAAIATHALVGYALGRVLVDRPWAGLVGGVLADVDLLVPRAMGWPLAHRGITHTALAAVVAVALAYAVARRRDVAGVVGLGYASQLLIDATTAQGVRLLYPAWPGVVVLPGDGHSGLGTVLLWLACGALLAVNRAIDGPVGLWHGRAADR